MRNNQTSYRQKKESTRNRIIIIGVSILVLGTLLIVLIVQITHSVRYSKEKEKTELMIEQNLEAKNYAPLVTLLDTARNGETNLSSYTYKKLAIEIIINADAETRKTLDSLFFEEEIPVQAGRFVIEDIRTGMLFGYETAKVAPTFSMTPLLRPQYGDPIGKLASEYPKIVLQLALLQAESFSLHTLESGLLHFLESSDVLSRVETSLANFDRIKKEFEVEVVRDRDLSYLEESIFEGERFIEEEWIHTDLSTFIPIDPEGKRIHSLFKESMRTLELLEDLEFKLNDFKLAALGTYYSRPKTEIFVIRSELSQRNGNQAYEAFHSDVGICFLMTSKSKFTSTGRARLTVVEGEPIVLEDNNGFDKEYPVYVEATNEHQKLYMDFQRSGDVILNHLNPIAEELIKQIAVLETLTQ